MKDWEKIKKLDERYSRINVTGFKLITNQAPGEVMRVIEKDIEIFNNVKIDNKYVTCMTVRDGFIDLLIRDNATPITYYFTEESNAFEEVVGMLEEYCNENNIGFLII